MLGLGIAFLVALALMGSSKPASAAPMPGTGPVPPTPKPPAPPVVVPPGTPPGVTPPPPPSAGPPAGGPPATPTSGTYTVKSGDTGEKIALAFTGNKGRWPELVTANPALKDPTYGLRIYAGQTIKLPATWGAPSATPVVTPVSTPGTSAPAPSAIATSDTYLVKSGDTGEKIALAFTGAKGRWPELVTANPSLKDPTYGLRIYAGQTIKLPPSWIQQAVTSGRRWVV